MRAVKQRALVRRGARPTQSRRAVRVGATPSKRHYAVCRGRETGVFHATWDEVRELVEGHKGSVVKVFDTPKEAEDYYSAFTQRAADEPATLVPGGQSLRHFDDKVTDELRQATAAAVQPYLLPPDGHTLNTQAWHRVEFDGGYRRNPDVMGCGAVLREVDTGYVVAVCAGVFVRGDAYTAEFRAALLGMEAASALGLQRLVVQGDSRNTVDHIAVTLRDTVSTGLSHTYKFFPGLRDNHFTSVVSHYVPREANRAADTVSSLALDTGTLWLSEPARLQPECRSAQEALGTLTATSSTPATGTGTTRIRSDQGVGLPASARALLRYELLREACEYRKRTKKRKKITGFTAKVVTVADHTPMSDAGQGSQCSEDSDEPM